MLELSVQQRIRPAVPGLTRYLRERLGMVCRFAGVTRGELTVMVVDERTMAKLHQQYLHLNTPTDVLTFDQREPAKSVSDDIQGDIVVCMQVAQREAQARGHTTRQELLLYAVHGLLHLLGHDDHDPQQALVMHQREDELLNAIGEPAIYRSKPKARAGRHTTRRRNR